jgi:urease gamma subunit
MSNIAIKMDPSRAAYSVGWVTDVRGTDFEVRVDDVTMQARRATSCLIEPLVRDRVLLVITGEGATFILAILEREGAETRLSVEGDLEIAPAGKFRVVASGVSVASSEEVALVAPSVTVSAVDGRFAVERLAVAGRHLLEEFVSIKTVSSILETVSDRLTQKVKRAYRTVTDLDQLKAQRIDWSSETTMHLHAENAVVTSDDLVKVDGKHIHMG